MTVVAGDSLTHDIRLICQSNKCCRFWVFSIHNRSAQLGLFGPNEAHIEDREREDRESNFGTERADAQDRASLSAPVRRGSSHSC
jgi:hypothetical protein